MNWTKRRPNTIGWYWIVDKYNEEQLIYFSHLMQNDVLEPLNSERIPISEITFWCGPLAPPLRDGEVSTW